MTIFITIPIAEPVIPEIIELGLLLIVLTAEISYTLAVIAETTLIAIPIRLSMIVIVQSPTFALQ
jgi:hypothetical protein